MKHTLEATVIVPAFNVEQYIGRCIRSITQTACGEIEVIVVDDGSTDNTGRIADDLGRADQRIRVFHTNNYGASRARNLALERSRGRYIFFVDADDYVEGGFIASAIDVFSASACDVLLLRAKFDNPDSGVFAQEIDPRTTELIREGANPVYAGYPLYLWNFAFRRDVVGSSRFDERLRVSEDADFISRVCANAGRFAVCDVPGYHYSVGRPGSALTKIDLDGCLDIKHVKAELIRRAGASDDVSRIVDEYGEASFGVLRRCATNKQIYTIETHIPDDLYRMLTKSNKLKSRLCVWAYNHEELLRPAFVVLSLFSKRLKIN